MQLRYYQEDAETQTTPDTLIDQIGTIFSSKTPSKYLKKKKKLP